MTWKQPTRIYIGPYSGDAVKACNNGVTPPINEFVYFIYQIENDDNVTPTRTYCYAGGNITLDVADAWIAGKFADLTTMQAAIDAVPQNSLGAFALPPPPAAPDLTASAVALALRATMQNIADAATLANAAQLGVTIPDGIQDAVNSNLDTASSSFTSASNAVKAGAQSLAK